MAVDIALALEKLGIQIKKNGRRYWAEECPMPTHGTPNPKHRYQNFFVRSEDPRVGQFFCYSCKSGGRLVELVAVLKGLDWQSAKAWLADLGDTPPPPYLRVRFDPVGPRGQPFRLPSGVQSGPLDTWPGIPATYARLRGITADQVARWQVGYAYDGVLAHRLVLPIWDVEGRLANYAARTFVDDEVRYRAAHDREHPDKSALYGEHLWPRLEQRWTGLVFEGALNGLALERALARFTDGDLEYVSERVAELPSLVGLSGSRFDYRKAAKMATFRRLLVATDPDKAGDEAFDEIYGALRRRAEVVRFEYPRRGADALDTPSDELADALVTQLRAAAA
jgi:hypothetical protein